MCDSVVWVYDTIGARLGDSGYVYDVSQWPRPLVIDNRTITACSATWCTVRLWALREENRFFEILKKSRNLCISRSSYLTLSVSHCLTAINWMRRALCWAKWAASRDWPRERDVMPLDSLVIKSAREYLGIQVVYCGNRDRCCSIAKLACKPSRYSDVELVRNRTYIYVEYTTNRK